MPTLNSTERFVIALHKECTNNKSRIETDGGGMCGCCLKDTKYYDFKWYELTAVCPHCGTDCVIPFSMAHSMSRESKEAFVTYWFGMEVGS